MTFPAIDLVHPFEAGPRTVPVPADLTGEACAQPQVLACVSRICAVLGLDEPQVYVSDAPGHAHAPGGIRIARRTLAGLAPDDVEALLAHLCGHLALPADAGELSADRVAAFYHGGPDAITRVIFAEAVHSGEVGEDPAVRIREIQAWTATPGFARLVADTRANAATT